MWRGFSIREGSDADDASPGVCVCDIDSEQYDCWEQRTLLLDRLGATARGVVLAPKNRVSTHSLFQNTCKSLDCFLEFCSVEYLLRSYFSFNGTRNETAQCIQPLFVNTWCKAQRADQQLSLGPREQRGDKFFSNC